MIKKFDGDFAFLSNFFICNLIIKGKTWPTTEHLFQACKTIDENEREKIRLCETPGKAKRMGRKITLRDDWFEIKETVMAWCLDLKVDKPEFAEKLLATGNKELIEGNIWHDNFWGDCSCPQCKDFIGINMLGRLLMKKREKLKNDYKNR